MIRHMRAAGEDDEGRTPFVYQDRVFRALFPAVCGVGTYPFHAAMRTDVKACQDNRVGREFASAPQGVEKQLVQAAKKAELLPIWQSLMSRASGATERSRYVLRVPEGEARPRAMGHPRVFRAWNCRGFCNQESEEQTRDAGS